MRFGSMDPNPRVITMLELSNRMTHTSARHASELLIALWRTGARRVEGGVGVVIVESYNMYIILHVCARVCYRE